MIKQTKDWARFEEEASGLVSEDAIGFDPQSLVEKKGNVLLTDGETNYSLFEEQGPNIYYGHYLFNNVKGRQAISLARDMLETLKKLRPNAEAVRGVISKDNKKAVWITRQLGFEYLFSHKTEVGLVEIYNLRLESNE